MPTIPTTTTKATAADSSCKDHLDSAPSFDSNDAVVATSSGGKKSHNWFHPRRWIVRRTPSVSGLAPSGHESAPSDHHHHHQGSKKSNKEQPKKDFEDLIESLNWSRYNRIAVLGRSEIQLEKTAETSPRPICNVESITLAGEHTAEYLQQEKYRMQIHKSTELFSLKRIPNGKGKNATTKNSKRKAFKILLQEATVLSKLQHPNIVTLRGLPTKACQTGDFFLLTDRLYPGTLENVIQHWRGEGKSSFSHTNTIWDPYLEFPSSDDDTEATPNDDMIPRKTNYAFQIAKALQACHKAGIVVRDLCPESIGFRADDPHCVQLIDLGHAQEQQESCANFADNKTSLVGKRRYLAGEIWKTGQYSPKTDVYSWAMVYYEMCMERKPFLGYSVQEHQKNVWENGDRPQTAQSYLPEGIDKILMQAWAHDPEQRLTMDQVCHKTQTLLMHLDSCLFVVDEEEGEFLFDLLVPSVDSFDDDDISELAEEDMEEDFELRLEAIFEEANDHLVMPDLDECLETSDSYNGNRRSRDSSLTPLCKVISSAA